MTSRAKYTAEDDLEYHINFPAPEPYERKALGEDIGVHSSSCENFQYISLRTGKPVIYGSRVPSKESHSKDVAHNFDDTSELIRTNTEPVIFLLGWLNAQDRHLSKYSSLYNKLGYITFRYTAPSKGAFGMPKTYYREIGIKLLKVLDDTALSHHPVIFHNFSNHGATLYSHISQLMEAPPQAPLHVIGCIYDSAPSSLSVSSVVRAVYRSVKGSIFSRFLVSAAAWVLMGSWKIFYVFSSLITGRIPTHAPWCLLQEPFRWPQLFLYSKVDDLVPYHQVELFATEREAMGIRVAMHEFVDSPHVMHLKSYPEEYAEVVGTFVKSCIQEETASEKDEKTKKDTRRQ